MECDSGFLFLTAICLINKQEIMLLRETVTGYYLFLLHLNMIFKEIKKTKLWDFLTF